MHHPRHGRVFGGGGVSGRDVVFVLLGPVDTKAEVAEIVLADVELADLVDNGNQIVERSNGLKHGGVRSTEDTTRGRQKERVFDNDGRDATIIEIRREETIVAADN